MTVIQPFQIIELYQFYVVTTMPKLWFSWHVCGFWLVTLWLFHTTLTWKTCEWAEHRSLSWTLCDTLLFLEERTDEHKSSQWSFNTALHRWQYSRFHAAALAFVNSLNQTTYGDACCCGNRHTNPPTPMFSLCLASPLSFWAVFRGLNLPTLPPVLSSVCHTFTAC